MNIWCLGFVSRQHSISVSTCGSDKNFERLGLVSRHKFNSAPSAGNGPDMNIRWLGLVSRHMFISVWAGGPDMICRRLGLVSRHLFISALSAAS